MKFTSNKIEPGLVLTVLFVLLLAVEAYFAYFLLLRNLTVADEGPDVKNIVRVDSKTYRSTLDYLTSLQDYQAPAEAYRNVFLKRPVQPANPPATASPAVPAKGPSVPTAR